MAGPFQVRWAPWENGTECDYFYRMIWMSLTHLAAAVILVADSTTGGSRSWIADIKANRALLAGEDVRLEGEVVDLRSTSPTARRGFYRLTDASDPGGVLVRTESLPMDGGNFRLVVRVAVYQMVDGALLVDEVERHRTDGPPILPMVLVTVSIVALVVLLVLFRKAVRQEREYLVSPPLWLLPDAGPYGKALAAPGTAPVALRYQPELEAADQMQRTQLKRRKRSLMQALFGSLAVTGSSAAWVIDTRPESGQVPAFIFIDANDPAARAARGRQAQDGREAIVAPDSALLLALDAPPMPAPAREAQPDPMAGRPKVAASQSDSTKAVLVRDTPLVDAPPRSEPVSLPSAAPVPAPAPPPEATEPARDPEVDRASAGQNVSAAAARLVAAINGRQMEELAILLPEVMAGNLGRRERFLKLVREFSPKATLGAVTEVAVNDDRGEAAFSIAFAWRGDFGVDRRKSGRFFGVARRQGDDWRFDGARLLDAVP